MNSSRENNRVVVVGGGLGGLATACTLAARGYAVTLCDKNAWVGGKAAVLSEQGFRFDMGPTILTIPGVLKRIYAEAGRDLEQHLDLVPLDPQWRSFFDDGTTLDLHADVALLEEDRRVIPAQHGVAQAGLEPVPAGRKRAGDVAHVLVIHAQHRGKAVRLHALARALGAVLAQTVPVDALLPIQSYGANIC